MGQIENSHIHYVIFGFGVSGKPSYKYLKSKGYTVSVISRGPVSSWIGNIAAQEDCHEQDSVKAKTVLQAADHIVLSPGISRDNPLLQNIDGEVINDIELFFRHLCSSPKIIAITGSNGKTTSVSLLNEILHLSGLNVFCGGNIGKSPVEFLIDGEKQDVVLLELSSFQLETIKDFCPDLIKLKCNPIIYSI